MSTTDLTNDPKVGESEVAADEVDGAGTPSPDTEPDTVERSSVSADDADAASQSDADGSAPGPTLGRRANIVAAVVLVVVIAAAVVAGFVWNRIDDNTAADARAADAVATAQRVVVDLTTLNHSDVKASVNRILAETTGDFRNQFASSSGAFQSALTQGQVDSIGRADSVGLIKADSSSAEVLVASSSTVKNTQAPQGDARVYRMKVSLDRSNDKWLVSNVEFVS